VDWIAFTDLAGLVMERLGDWLGLLDFMMGVVLARVNGLKPLFRCAEFQLIISRPYT
jgi:hypothetical protein